MAKKEKEEDRIERIIRNLLKLPENRRCINCNSLGPQYVCTTFLTFVCTNCSGIHREFTHRVKSVSMAKFSAEEVSALQAAGNERARQIYFKEWDSQRNSYPDGSDLHRLRDFIKHIYVDRKYTGNRNHQNLPKLRLSSMEESYESRKPREPKNLNYEDRREQSEKFCAGGRSRYCEEKSPRHSLEHPRYGGFKKNATQFEVVDDRFRDDRIHSGRQPNSNRHVHKDSSASSSSPDHYKNRNPSSSPVVRPLKDILGEHAPPIHVDEQSKAPNGKDADGSAHNQKIVHAGSMASGACDPVEQKRQDSADGLIDFNPELKPSDDAAAAPKTQESTKGGNHNSQESSTKENAPPAPKSDTLEFLLLELSGPLVTVGLSEVTGNANPPRASGGNMPKNSDVSDISSAVPPGQILPNGIGTSEITPGGSTSMSSAPPSALPGKMLTLSNSVGASTTAAQGNKHVPAGSILSAATVGQESTSTNGAGSSPTGLTSSSSNGAAISLAGPMATSLHSDGNSTTGAEGSMPATGILPGLPAGQTLSLLDNFDSSTTSSNTNLPVQLYNVGPPQAAALINNDPVSRLPNGQEVTSIQFPTSIDGSNLAKDSNFGARFQPHPAETNSDRRKELPADLFTASYSPFPGPITGWQAGAPYSMGYGMQYYANITHVPAYANPRVSTNPFDLNSGTTPAQAPAFPSIGTLHGALPYVAAPRLLAHTFSIGSDSLGSIPTQSPSCSSAMHLGSPSIASTMSSGQQVMNMPTSRQQADGGIGGSGMTFGLLDSAPQPTNGYSLTSPPSSFPSKGGNPFG